MKTIFVPILGLPISVSDWLLVAYSLIILD